jgi:hypothetical protein
MALLRKRKTTKNKKTPSKNRLREGFKKWTAYYRAMPHRFAEDYLGVKLFLYQKFLLWAMNYYSFFMYIAARGQGKY